jgi:protein-disulfide isomerase
LIEFADFECAFCARHHPEIRKLMTEFAGQVDFVHVHSPLPQHRFAIPAARAAECAVEQGRFPQMQDALYAYQDSLGFFSWHRYAEIAGVPDSAQFAECIAHPRSLVRVDSGQALSARLSIPGTPTFLVNGHVVAGGGPDSLRSLIRSALEAAQR